MIVDSNSMIIYSHINDHIQPHKFSMIISRVSIYSHRFEFYALVDSYSYVWESILDKMYDMLLLMMM